MKSAISLQGAVRVEYRIQLKTLDQNSSLIAAEHRVAGGSGAVAALALVSLGASVRLRAQPIGDDSHGRFLLAQLQDVPGLELDVEVQKDRSTPYAILVREENGATRTWLSPEAAQLEGPQDYPALLEFLRETLRQWDEAPGEEGWIERFVDKYDAEFAAPSFEER